MNITTTNIYTSFLNFYEHFFSGSSVYMHTYLYILVTFCICNNSLGSSREITCTLELEYKVQSERFQKKKIRMQWVTQELLAWVPGRIAPLCREVGSLERKGKTSDWSIVRFDYSVGHLSASVTLVMEVDPQSKFYMIIYIHSRQF